MNGKERRQIFLRSVGFVEIIYTWTLRPKLNTKKWVEKINPLLLRWTIPKKIKNKLVWKCKSHMKV